MDFKIFQQETNRLPTPGRERVTTLNKRVQVSRGLFHERGNAGAWGCYCIRFNTPFWRKEIWIKRQSSWSTGRFSFLPSPRGMRGRVMTEKTRSRIEAAETCSLRRVACFSFRDRMKNLVNPEKLGEEPLILCMEMSQLKWFGYLVEARCHDHAQWGGGHGAERGLEGEIISPDWHGNGSESPEVAKRRG